MEIGGRFNADCIVIGSGFGGSAMAWKLAEADKSVLVLERGGEYGPGDFPRTPLQSSTNLWDPSLGLYGMFDVWSFRKFEALVSSGVGGGSLIYANVMLPKPEPWFAHQRSGPMAEYWPIGYQQLKPHYEHVHDIFAVEEYPYVKTTKKTKLFEQAATSQGLDFEPAPLAVRFGASEEFLGMPYGSRKDNRHNKQRFTCRKCGECDVGCNNGSKNSTDFTYLSHPRLRKENVLAHHEVKDIIPLGRPEDGYRVKGVIHEPPNPLDARDHLHEPEPFSFTSKTVVLAAGSFGTTYLLLRNRRLNLPRLSPALGTKFSGNGDYLGLIHAGKEHVVESSRAPVITGLIRAKDTTDVDAPWPGTGGDRGYLIQDGGYPLLGDWLSETVGIKPLKRFAGTLAVWLLARYSPASRAQISGLFSRAIGPSRRSRTMLPVLGIGRDLPGGLMTLRGDSLNVTWHQSHSEPVFSRIEDGMRRIATGMNGEFHRTLSAMLSRMTSVHPLGGAPMSKDPRRGVVDEWGEVYGYPGLFVADGSVMPGSVGVNPAMTIAAVAEMFAERVSTRC